jgi:hypothetical protein
MAMANDERNDGRRNQLLSALETASRERIDPHLEPIKLKLGDIVCEASGLLKHAYFPEGAVLSLLTVLENGSAIETHRGSTCSAVVVGQVGRSSPALAKGHVSNFAQTLRTGARIFLGPSLLTEGSCARLGTTHVCPVGSRGAIRLFDRL